MKKLLLIVLSIVFVLGFIAADYAAAAADATDITISGSIRSRGEFRDNTADFSSDGLNDNPSSANDNRSTMDTRVRLKVDAVVTPNTKGVIELESYSSSDTYEWGDGGSSQAYGTYQRGNYKPTALYIRQAYIDHHGTGLLGREAGFKVGHMLIGLGNGLFLDHTKFGDDALIFWVDPEGTTVSFTYVKFREGSNVVNDDVNAYVLAVEAPLNSSNVSADLTLVDDQDFTSFGPALQDTEALRLWNLGLRGDTAINGINLRANVELQYGKAKSNFVDPITAARGDRKYRGYAWLVGADTTVSDTTLSAEVAYGSGDKITYDTTTPTGRSGSKNEAFQTSLGSSQHYTYVYEYRAVSAASGYGGSTTGTGLSNTWYINVGASKKVNPDLKVSTDLYFLRASQAVALGTTPARNANGTYKTSKNLGTELDGKLEYQIDTNLVYFVEGGYLWAGAAYDRDDPTVVANGTNLGPDNAYAVRHGVTLKF